MRTLIVRVNLQNDISGHKLSFSKEEKSKFSKNFFLKIFHYNFTQSFNNPKDIIIVLKMTITIQPFSYIVAAVLDIKFG